MDMRLQPTDDCEPRGDCEHRSALGHAGRRRLSHLLSLGGVLLTIALTAFLVLPLVALVMRAPLRMLKTAECCSIVREAMTLSMTTSLLTTLLAFVIGTPVAYIIATRKFLGRRWLELLIELPLTLPPVVAGVALILAFGRRGLVGQYLSVLGIELSFTQVAVVMAQFMVASPHYIKTAIAAFQSVPQELVQASRTLGAGPTRTLFKVTLPLCRNALLAGLALTWARAIGEFGATIMFAGNFPGRTQTMPLAVMSTMQQNLHAGIVLAVIMLVVCLTSLAVIRRLLARHLPSPSL